MPITRHSPWGRGLQADHDDKEHKALNAFNELWRSKFAHDSLLVFSTGRSHALYSQLRVCPEAVGPQSVCLLWCSAIEAYASQGARWYLCSQRVCGVPAFASPDSFVALNGTLPP